MSKGSTRPEMDLTYIAAATICDTLARGGHTGATRRAQNASTLFEGIVRMMKPLLMGIAAFAVTAGGMAIAQDMGPPPPPGGPIMRADTNGDGAITRQEVIDQAASRFDRMDLNHDGKLDRTELAEVRPRMRAMRGDMPPPPPPPAPQQQ